MRWKLSEGSDKCNIRRVLLQHEHDPFSQVSYRDNDGSVNIIISFGRAGSPGQLILFPTELKAPDMGVSLTEIPMSGAFCSVGSPNCPSIDRKPSKSKLDHQIPYTYSVKVKQGKKR